MGCWLQWKQQKVDKIIIFGDKNHPEIKGIIGRCMEEPIVIKNEEEIENTNFIDENNYILAAQTTFNIDNAPWLKN